MKYEVGLIIVILFCIFNPMTIIYILTYSGELKCKLLKKHQFYTIVGGCFAGGDTRIYRDKCEYCGTKKRIESRINRRRK